MTVIMPLFDLQCSKKKINIPNSKDTFKKQSMHRGSQASRKKGQEGLLTQIHLEDKLYSF